MDGTRFDRWTRTLGNGNASRRGIMRATVGGGLAVLGIGLVVQPALACRQNGKPCAEGSATKRNRSCCSGTCKKGTCRPTPGAAGCTAKASISICRAQSEEPNPCPNKAGFCIKQDNGKPFCANTASCFNCQSNADCTEAGAELGLGPGKCVSTTSCDGCGETNNRACLFENLAGTSGSGLQSGLSFR